MRRFDGVYRWFLFLGNPLRDQAGNIVKWFGANVDIDDRKRAEEALRPSERNLDEIINTLPTTAWSTRPDGYCDFLSDRWLDYAGFTVEEALGWSWGAVIHPDDAKGAGRLLARLPRRGRAGGHRSANATFRRRISLVLVSRQSVS